MKRKLTILWAIVFTIMLVACSGSVMSSTGQTITTEAVSVGTVSQTTSVLSAQVAAEYDSDDLTVSTDDAGTTTIAFEGDSIQVEGNGASANGAIVTVTSAGTYRFSGILDNGQIIVDTVDPDTVVLVLDGIDLTYNAGAPIYVANAEKVVITLADGLENTVTDGATYDFPDESDEPDAAIFSHDDLTINGNGSLTVNAIYNNGIASKDDLKIISGTITVNAVNDGIKGRDSVTVKDGEITINGGEITITQSYEGIDSAAITVNNGTIHLTASDDGFNAAGGTDGSSIDGRPGQNNFVASGNYHLYINGGYIFVDAGGDGLDSNGPIDMTGGTVIVNGPTNNGNGPLDYTGSFNITGGYLLAVGSSGMAQAPSNTSTQYAVMYNFDTMLTAGKMVHIETQAGEDILTFMPAKEYQSVLLSSSALQNGETYVVYTGGGSTGTAMDGLFSDGDYTAGTQVTSFTVTGIITGGGMMTGGPGGRPGGSGGLPPARP